MAKKNTPKDPYTVLGVGRTADAAAIKRAYRKRSKESHPDAGGKAEDFHDVAAAHRILSDPVKRLTYDRTGEVDDVTQADDAHAMTMIASLLEQYLTQAGESDTWTKDIVAVFRNSLRDSRLKLDQAIAGMKRSIISRQKLAKKFKVKKGHNILRTMVERKILDLETSMASAEASRRHMTRAIDLLEDSSFDVDDPFGFGMQSFYLRARHHLEHDLDIPKAATGVSRKP